MADVVIRHRIATTTTDAGGNVVAATWSTEALPGTWLFAPHPTDDVTATGRDGSEVAPTLYGPADADVTDRDRLEVRGTVHKVVGLPGRWDDEGLVVRLEAVEG